MPGLQGVQLNCGTHVCVPQRRASEKGSGGRDDLDYSRATPKILTKERREPQVEKEARDKKSSSRRPSKSAAAATRAQVRMHTCLY